MDATDNKHQTDDSEAGDHLMFSGIRLLIGLKNKIKIKSKLTCFSAGSVLLCGTEPKLMTRFSCWVLYAV